MKYEIIGSSSKGNAIVVEDILLLDCGVSFAKIKKKIKYVKVVFISHVHRDHLNPTTIRQIAYNKPTIKFIAGDVSVISLLKENGVADKNIFYLKDRRKYSLGCMFVMLEKVTHDVPNFLLKFYINGKSGIYIVDTSNVDNIKAKGYDLYLIENNYQEKVLQEHIDNCTDEGELKYLKRVPLTHLSAEQANSFLIENMKESSYFAYIHQSSYNFRGEG